MSALPVVRYEPLLKEELKCWRCHATLKNIPSLKAHLQEEWGKEKRKATTQKKRKRGDVTSAVAQGESAEEDPESTRQTKRLETLETASESHA
jgi:aprataxin